MVVRVNYSAVRELSIDEIVRLWHVELDIDPITLDRELRASILNMAPGRDWQAEGLIDPLPSDDELPSSTTRLTREHVWEFCEKQQGWPLPTFWFPPDPAETPRPGRPSIKSAIVQEFRERVAREETETTISGEARAIKASLEAKGVADVPQEKTIQGHIRAVFNALQ